jgi:2-dehydro-3-deoxyphosphogluconate aldolase/(4S)-4-hydroxy-2-oxoglutarate aldolase
MAVADAGGLFAISPGLTPGLLDAASEATIPLIPGISTVSELMTGLERGFRSFKFFPAEAAGGIRMLKAISGPFPQARFCPTGGVSEENYLDYLALENVVCVGGSWICPRQLIEQGEWGKITELSKKALTLAEKAEEAE